MGGVGKAWIEGSGYFYSFPCVTALHCLPAVLAYALC